MAKVIGFSVDDYARFDGDGVYKNIVPLEEMLPRQRYETALEDTDCCIIFDNAQTFVSDLNDECIDANGYWFYVYEDCPF